MHAKLCVNSLGALFGSLCLCSVKEPAKYRALNFDGIVDHLHGFLAPRQVRSRSEHCEERLSFACPLLLDVRRDEAAAGSGSSSMPSHGGSSSKARASLRLNHLLMNAD
jgi:hypothetical protein